MWTWSQSKGELLRDGVFIANGYSGADLGKNNPAMQAAVGVGPIPRGQWRMTGIENGGPTGPFTIILEPCSGTDCCGRSAFRIHGDSISHPGSASHGCVIVPRPVRERMWDSLDHLLEVVA